MQKRNILHSPRLLELKKHRRRVFLSKVLLFLLALSAIFALLAYISRLPGLNISSLEIIGNKVIETGAIKDVVELNLKGKYFWLFPKTNVLFYPKNKIKQDLSLKFKRLKDIEFSIKDKQMLAVKLAEREALYTWCGDNLPDIEKKTEEYLCYFTDENGYVFDEAPYFSGDVYFRFFGSLTESYFIPGIFTKIVSFKDFLSNVGVKPVSLYVKSDGDIEIYLSSRYLPPEAPKIIFKKDFNPEKLSENLEAALNTEPLLSDFKNKYSSLLYIDLRYG